MLDMEFFPYDDYHGKTGYDIICDVCGDCLIGTSGIDIRDIGVINAVKRQCGWKSVCNPKFGWIDICPQCYKEHPELHFRRSTAKDDFENIIPQMTKKEVKKCMDTYDVSFKAKIEGADEYAQVGDDWICYTAHTSAMIKDVCGSYPTDWHGVSCKKLIPILEAGIHALKEHSDKYALFDPSYGYRAVLGTTAFLSSILENCKRYPYAFVVVE